MRGGPQRAAEWLAEASDTELRCLDPWAVGRGLCVNGSTVRDLWHAEQLKRGLIAPTDLTPDQRRRLVDPTNVDVHAIAAGPIMDPAKLYLPAGVVSLAEVRRREAVAIVPTDHKMLRPAGYGGSAEPAVNQGGGRGSSDRLGGQVAAIGPGNGGFAPP